MPCVRPEVTRGLVDEHESLRTQEDDAGDRDAGREAQDVVAIAGDASKRLRGGLVGSPRVLAPVACDNRRGMSHHAKADVQAACRVGRAIRHALEGTCPVADGGESGMPAVVVFVSFN